MAWITPRNADRPARTRRSRPKPSGGPRAGADRALHREALGPGLQVAAPADRVLRSIRSARPRT